MKEIKINEKENEKNETKKTIKVFVRDTFVVIQIGTSIYSAFGVTNFSSEKEVEERIQELSLVEIDNFNVSIIHYDSLLEIASKYFSLRLYKKTAILYLEDKSHPEYTTWNKHFELKNEEALLLFKYFLSHAENISFDF